MAPIIHLPDTVVGAFLVVMALLSGFKQIRVGSAKNQAWSTELRKGISGETSCYTYSDHTHCNVCGCSVYKVRCFDGTGAGIYSGHNRRHDNVPGRFGNTMQEDVDSLMLWVQQPRCLSSWLR